MICLDKKSSDFIFCSEYFQYLLDNHIEFDEEDLWMFIECCQIALVKGENHRWDREMTSICQLDNNKCYAIEWRHGLTEMQEDYIGESQPYEVIPVKKVIEITEWKRKDRGE